MNQISRFLCCLSIVSGCTNAPPPVGDIDTDVQSDATPEVLPEGDISCDCFFNAVDYLEPTLFPEGSISLCSSVGEAVSIDVWFSVRSCFECGYGTCLLNDIGLFQYTDTSRIDYAGGELALEIPFQENGQSQLNMEYGDDSRFHVVLTYTPVKVSIIDGSSGKPMHELVHLEFNIDCRSPNPTGDVWVTLVAPPDGVCPQ
jgi:hypothetical protein